MQRTPEVIAALAFSLVCAGGCHRAGNRAVCVPATATIELRANFPELRPFLAPFVQHLPPKTLGDHPAYFFCDAGRCALHVDGASSSSLQKTAGGFRAPDGGGSVWVWGARDARDAAAALQKWRAADKDPPDAGDGRMVVGQIWPQRLLRQWQPRRRRARQLVERAGVQLEPVTVTGRVSHGVVKATLLLSSRRAVPKLVGDLGEPTAPLSGAGGLAGERPLAVVRVAADPTMLWTLLRSTFSAEKRGEIDKLAERLRKKAAFDFRRDVVDALTGNVAVFVYDVHDAADANAADWLRLSATDEAVVFGVRERRVMRRALDAWTQLSDGHLDIRKADDGPKGLRWTWHDADAPDRTLVLGPKTLAIADSSVALDHLDAAKKPADGPTGRGIRALVDPAPRSGIYLDVAALRAARVKWARGFPLARIDWLSAVETSGDADEVKLRLGLSAQKP